jgi:hypothetical protein
VRASESEAQRRPRPAACRWPDPVVNSSAPLVPSLPRGARRLLARASWMVDVDAACYLVRELCSRSDLGYPDRSHGICEATGQVTPDGVATVLHQQNGRRALEDSILDLEGQRDSLLADEDAAARKGGLGLLHAEKLRRRRMSVDQQISEQKYRMRSESDLLCAECFEAQLSLAKLEAEYHAHADAQPPRYQQAFRTSEKLQPLRAQAEQQLHRLSWLGGQKALERLGESLKRTVDQRLQQLTQDHASFR